MTTSSSVDRDLAAAYGALVAEGVNVTVRALRDRARCNNEAARRWLEENRPSADAGEPPADLLTAAFAPLWSAAVIAAREAVGEALTEQVAQARQAEAAALDDVQRLTDELAATTKEAEAQTAEVQRLGDQRLVQEAEVDRLTALVAEVTASAATAATEAADRVHAAEELARAAQIAEREAAATVRTLRAVIDQITGKSD